MACCGYRRVVLCLCGGGESDYVVHRATTERQESSRFAIAKGYIEHTCKYKKICRQSGPLGSTGRKQSRTTHIYVCTHGTFFGHALLPPIATVSSQVVETTSRHDGLPDMCLLLPSTLLLYPIPCSLSPAPCTLSLRGEAGLCCERDVGSLFTVPYYRGVARYSW